MIKTLQVLAAVSVKVEYAIFPLSYMLYSVNKNIVNQAHAYTPTQ